MLGCLLSPFFIGISAVATSLGILRVKKIAWFADCGTKPMDSGTVYR